MTGEAIQESKAPDSRWHGPQAIVSVLFAWYLVAHHVYLFGSGREGLILAAIFLVPPAVLMIRPGSLGLFLVNAAVHLAQFFWVQPIFSNHALMSFFFAAGLLAVWLYLLARQRRLRLAAEDFYQAYAPLGRWLLIGMYVYGTLHKVNADFLDAEVSCAVSLWRRYGFPEVIAESALLHQATIYGTLILEASVIVMLLIPRLRWLGIVVGIAFHGFLGFLPPGYIRAYSLFAIVLHGLFLPPNAMELLRQSRPWRALLEALTPLWPRAGAVALAIAAYLLLPAWLGWWIVLGLIIALTLAAGREQGEAAIQVPRAGKLLRIPSVLVAVFVAVFFLNGFSPYLGFKSGQTIAMFSNLHTEGGETNHLIFDSYGVSSLQSRVASEIDTDHPLLSRWAEKGYHLVEFQVLDHLERHPQASARYIVDGESFAHSPDAAHPAIAELPPRWIRNFMVFRPVAPERPRRCDSY